MTNHLAHARAVHRENDERGAVAVITALCLVVLVGFAAIAIDVGMMYEERAQLQNGADAAAFAVAQDCAVGTDCLDASAVLPRAQQMADANARDARSKATILELDKTKQKVRVQASTVDGKSGAGSLALSFAPVLGIDKATVGATASAVWGAPKAGTAMFPIAFAACEFHLTGAPQVLVLGGKGPTKCPKTGGSTGHVGDLPGGFGWIGEKDSTSCGVYVAAGDTVKSSTGASIPSGCTTAATEAALKNRTVLLPVYDQIGVGTGNNGTYRIAAWAAFEVHGYTFTGNVNWNPGLVTGACGTNCDGIYGRFVRFVTLDDAGFVMGPPTSYGTTVVELRD
ncbi:pilus assembly protein TadG-related protein [Kocuria sabuli]|uniref:pilus assembly protein TadG-related protein n=1 Tax=Kocuria sabuli TaxID=3071448 RepID=UPI0034D4B427